ncbi:hypothetical protein HSX11_02420 [Oxalobacteraceae bacterium]|nr:hypothetical protein [Oxalobacteraceae bacterium]
MVITDAIVRAAVVGPEVLKLHDLVAFSKQKNRHFLLFESVESLDLIVNTYSENIRPIYRELLEQSVRGALTFPSGRTTIKVDVVENSDWSLPIPTVTLDDSLKVLNEKLAILLENSTHDWHFLLGIMSPMDRKLIKDYVALGWAEPMHGGGDTLGKLLDDRIDVPWASFRTFVLFDSDRLHPNEFHVDWTTARHNRRPASCHAYEWEKKTKQHIPLRYWMLQRRYIESYMPKNELKIGKEKKATDDAVDAFFAMSQAERWYYNMKEGFAKDAKRDDSERSQDLYNNVLEAQRVILNDGFGNTLARHYLTSIEKSFDWDPEARAEADLALPRLLQLL